jgi:hypothetical protein
VSKESVGEFKLTGHAAVVSFAASLLEHLIRAIILGLAR